MRTGKIAVCIGDYHADVVVQKSQVPELTDEIVQKMWDGAYVPGVTYPPGGVGLSVSCSMARLGTAVRPMGFIGNDKLGRVALDTLHALDIDTQFLIPHPTRHSITVLCMTDEDGERSFCYGDPMDRSADVAMTAADIPDGVLDGVGLLYVSGIQLVFEPGCDTALEMMRRCKEKGITVAVDLNLRVEQYKPEGALLQRYLQAVEYSDIVFGSGEEELMVLYGGADPYEASKRITAMGKTVVCKLGSKGAAVFGGGEQYYHPAFPAVVVDTIGAGDNFVGGFLAAWLQEKPLAQCLAIANAVGAYSVSHAGADGSPTTQQVEEMLAEHNLKAEVIA